MYALLFNKYENAHAYDNARTSNMNIVGHSNVIVSILQDVFSFRHTTDNPVEL